MEDYAWITGLPVPQTGHTQAHTLLLQKVSMWKHLILMSQITTSVHHSVYACIGCQNVTQEDPDGPILSDDDTNYEDYSTTNQ